jgi:hypothetical protein
MKVIKKDAKANTEDTLEKKEKKKAKTPKGVQVMTQTPKKAKGIAKVMEVPGKEKSLNEDFNPANLPKDQVLAAFNDAKAKYYGEKPYNSSFKEEGKKALETMKRQGIVSYDSVRGYELLKSKLKEDSNKKKVKALRESILDEMTKINPEHEHFQVGARVKKKDNSLVGEITEWDGDTATVKTDEGQVHHIQGNILTKKDVPSPKEEAAQTGTTDEWANPKAHIPENKEIEESREDKMKSLKEKLMKAVKKELEEDMFTKGSGPAAQTVTASSPTSKSALTQKGFRQIPNTGDVKSI